MRSEADTLDAALGALLEEDPPPVLDAELIAEGGRLLARGLDFSALVPGQELGDYTVEDVLGRGGQGTVYRVRDRAGRPFALKIPRREVLPRLEREAQILFHLEHPHIIRIEEACLGAVVPHIVTELVRGGSLADRLRRTSAGLPVSEVARIARAVLLALQCAHDSGVVHRDIKPSNILFTADGTVKVADFGVGSFHTAAGRLSQSLTSRVSTRVGVGTPLYMAPEQLFHRTVDGRADLYALGKLLYQSLTGRPPRTLRPVSRLRGDVLPAWDELIFSLVEEHPDERPASARAVLDALGRLESQESAVRHAAALLSAGRSDRGRVRKANEDALGRWPRAAADAAQRLFVVCDGVGGHAGGQVASRLAVAEVCAAFAASERDGAGLREAVVAANRAVWQRAQAQPELARMGSTCVALAVDGLRGWVAHAGDSRLYRVRDGKIRCLTEDHSLVASLLREGIISPEQAARHPDRHVILRCLGSGPQVEVELRGLELCEGDLYLLCSDGISGPVRPEEMLTLLERHRDDPDSACLALIDLANERGGDDNATVQIVALRRPGGAPPPPREEPPAPAPPPVLPAPPRFRRWTLPLLGLALCQLGVCLAGGAFLQATAWGLALGAWGWGLGRMRSRRSDGR